ncbi:hypothetical protein D3C72_1342440 [compost metagenome]
MPPTVMGIGLAFLVSTSTGTSTPPVTPWVVVPSQLGSAGQLLPPPLATARFVTVSLAVAPTFTAILMAGALAPAAMTAVEVQVTAWPAMEQAQPVPVAAVGTIPVGSVSVIVMVPLVGVAEAVLASAKV